MLYYIFNFLQQIFFCRFLFEQCKNPNIKEKCAVTGVIKINQYIKQDYYNHYFVKFECICILHYSFLSLQRLLRTFPRVWQTFCGIRVKVCCLLTFCIHKPLGGDLLVTKRANFKAQKQETLLRHRFWMQGIQFKANCSAVDKQCKSISKQDCTKCTVQFFLANDSIKYDI